MDFGRVEFSQLSDINFKLPKEPYSNSNILKGRPLRSPKFYVGLAKWGRKEWIGKIYPKGTKEKDFQQEYQKHFDVLEFNSTHYKLPSDQDIDKWLEKANDCNLIFCPKVYQGISHFGSLSDKQFLTDVFLKSLRKFGNHLGPVFLQVSDKFGPKRKEELFNYLTTLPRDLQFFLEVRHPDWFQLPTLNDLIYTLQKLKIGFVISDTAGRRDVAHMHLTVPKTMIRFVANDLHETDFKRLDGWILRIKYWVESGLEEIYFFVHSLNEKFAPELAQYLIKGLNEHCNAGLREIQFIDQAK
jgi:uncharacterized protein YecE (DUF72 family)